MSETGEKLPETPDIDAMSDEQFTEFKKTQADPKPEAEKQPEVASDDQDDDSEPEAGGEKQATVPHQKFHRANERAKAEKARADEAERRQHLAMQRLTELLEASKPPPQEQEDDDPDPMPPEDDPIGLAAWAARKIEEDRRQKAEAKRQDEEQAGRATAVTHAYNAVNARFIEKSNADPDLSEAYSALTQSFAHELAVLGHQGMLPNGQVAPGSPLAEELKRVELQHVAHVYRSDIPIEDYVKNLATARTGWKPGAKNGQPRDETGKFKAEADRIDKLEATKKAAKSLGGSGAPVEMGELSPQAILDMDEEQFSAFKKKYGEKAMQKVFGAA